MNNSEKIFMILTNGFDPDVRVYKEAKYLKNKGFDIEIVCWDRKGDYLGKLEDEVENIKIKRFYIPSKPGTGMKQIIPFIKFIKSVRKYLKDKNYSYLHCHDFDGMTAGLFTKRRKDKMIIFDMHEIYKNYSYAKNRVFDFIFNKYLRKSQYIIYVNDEQIKGMASILKEKTVFLPNYPEEKIYIPIKKSFRNKTRVNYVGSLRDYESLDTLSQIGLDNEQIQVGLYGMGICFDKLNEKYKNTNIKIYGKYNGISESGEIYRNTDILYCSYNPEIKNWKTAYPVKLFESIITLTPIIVSEDTEVSNFVKVNEIGESIQYGDKTSIINAINKIKTHYEEYVENIKKIANDYKWEKIVRNLDRIYK